MNKTVSIARKTVFTALTFLGFHTLAFTPIAAAQPTQPSYISIRALPDKTTVHGGDTITVGLEHTMADGWHTYWKNPGDSGTKARVTWSGLDGIEAKDIQWPTPKKLPTGPLVNFGYDGRAVLLQDLTLPKTLPAGPHTLTARVDVLVCHDICIPETHTVSFEINGKQYPANPALFDAAKAKLPIDVGWDTTIAEQGDDLIVTLQTDTPSAFQKLKTVELYPEEWGLIDNTATTQATLKGDILTLHHKRGDRPLSDVPVSKLVIAYDMPSGERVSVRVSAGDSSLAAKEPSYTSSNILDYVSALAFALLGGLILNLMPCVFPVLSMKALSLIHLKDKENKTARIHGLAYTAGILVSFVVVAGILIALKAAGAQVGWGFQLQNPYVILGLSYLFFTLGLNLAGFFDMNISLAHAGDSLTRRHGLEGSFFTGVLATLVATPCTAPFMAGALGYALTQPPILALLIFVFLGLGLSLPYLVLTFVPAARHLLPKPGLWMEQFRQFLSFPMMLGACWLLWVLSQQINHMGQFAALLGMLCIAFAIWAYKTRPKHPVGKSIFLMLSLAAILGAFSTFVIIHPEDHKDMPTTGTQNAEDNWQTYSPQILEEALKGDGPVFVNMTAAWCITCKVNEKTALSTQGTRDAFARNKVLYLKGDWTNQDAEITKYLERYGRNGVPLYVYYAPRDPETGARPDALVLPQILTPHAVQDIVTP